MVCVITLFQREAQTLVGSQPSRALRPSRKISPHRQRLQCGQIQRGTSEAKHFHLCIAQPLRQLAEILSSMNCWFSLTLCAAGVPVSGS